MIGVPRQDPIEVEFDADVGEISIQQEQMGQDAVIWVNPANVAMLIKALEAAYLESKGQAD